VITKGCLDASLHLPHFSCGAPQPMAEKIIAITYGENKEESTCGYLLLVINQTVAISAMASIHLWRGGWW